MAAETIGNIEADVPGEAGGGVDFRGDYAGQARDQKDIVERDPFGCDLIDHGRLRSGDYTGAPIWRQAKRGRLQSLVIIIPPTDELPGR